MKATAVALSLLAAALSGPAGAAAPERSTRGAAELMDAVMWNREPIGGPFALRDQHGRLRRDGEFRGRWMLVYFGFATCPDICPTDLAQISEALAALGPVADRVAPIFVTLDPERDRPAVLAQYVAAFDPRIVALGGTRAQVAALAEAYRVYWSREKVEGALRYTIDHSSFLYLMDPQGRFAGFLPPGSPAGRIETVLRERMQAGTPRP